MLKFLCWSWKTRAFTIIMYDSFSIIGPTRCTICFQFITINSLHMFQALMCSSSGGTVCTTVGIYSAYYVGWQPADLIRTKYTNCCIYSASWWWAHKCLKHVEAINRNKLKANSASGWSYYTDILWCTVNKTLSMIHCCCSMNCA
jgi:hypothetical protein